DVRRKQVPDRRRFELAVEVLDHPHDVVLAHQRVDLPAGRGDLRWIDWGNVDLAAHGVRRRRPGGSWHHAAAPLSRRYTRTAVSWNIAARSELVKSRVSRLNEFHRT